MAAEYCDNVTYLCVISFQEFPQAVSRGLAESLNDTRRRTRRAAYSPPAGHERSTASGNISFSDLAEQILQLESIPELVRVNLSASLRNEVALKSSASANTTYTEASAKEVKERWKVSTRGDSICFMQEL